MKEAEVVTREEQDITCPYCGHEEEDAMCITENWKCPQCKKESTLSE